MTDSFYFVREECELLPLFSALQDTDLVGVDTETTGLNPRRDRVRLLQVATVYGCWVIDCFQVDPSLLWPYLASKRVVMHNAIFDLQFLAASFGWEPTSVICTQLTSQVLYCGKWVAGELVKQTSLRACVERELGVVLDKDLQASDWAGDLTDEQMTYAARDAAVLLPLWWALEVSLEREGLLEVAELEFRAVRAVAWASYYGVGFDSARWTALAEEARREAEALVPLLEQHVPENYRRAQRVPINWNSRAAALGALCATGLLLSDANNDSLKKFNHRVTDLILEWRCAFRDADQAELTRLSEQLDALLPTDYLRSREPVVNWHSTHQKAALLAHLGVTLPRTEKGNARVDDATLAEIDHPLATLLRKYSDAVKRAERTSWLEFVEGDRIYPSWWQCGTETGRMSCSRPPLQQVPRASEHRACFVAPPGRVLVKADYSQIELRIAAVISHDATMLEAYHSGEDLHTKTALTMLGRDFLDAEEKKKARQLAKACNFGLIYGLGAKKLAAYARSSYGVEMTDEEATWYRSVFFRTYSGLRRWQRRAGDDGSSAVFTRAGRRRLLTRRVEDESFFTKRLNTPVQGTGADGLKYALALLYERRAECPDAFPVLAEHDEIVIEASEERKELAIEWLKWCMLDGMANLVAPVPVEVEVSIGRTWAGK